MINATETAAEHPFEEAVDVLERLNQAYPHLANQVTRGAVEQWRNMDFKRQISVPPSATETSPSDPWQALHAYALDLLQTSAMEPVLEQVSERHGSSLSYGEFVDLIGKGHYIALLRKEALELQANAVSHQQIASLWNDNGRPALGDLLWTSRCIASLLG